MVSVADVRSGRPFGDYTGIRGDFIFWNLHSKYFRICARIDFCPRPDRISPIPKKGPTITGGPLSSTSTHQIHAASGSKSFTAA